MSIADHLETYLGTIDWGWRLNDRTHPIQAVRFNNQPFEGAITYSTLGMSDFAFALPGTSKQVSMELLFTAWKNFPSDEIASFLLSFCEFILSKGCFLSPGDVIGPSQPIIDNVAANAVFISHPMIFCDELAIFKETSPWTIFPWVIPIMEQEAYFVKSNGWSEFADLLEYNNPDLLDLNRPSII